MVSVIAVGVSDYALYLMRITELLVGSTNYLSTILTLFTVLVPVKYGLYRLHRSESGWFFLIGGLFSFFWSSRLILTVRHRNNSRHAERFVPSHAIRVHFKQDCRSVSRAAVHDPLGVVRTVGDHHLVRNRNYRHSFLDSSQTPHPVSPLRCFLSDSNVFGWSVMGRASSRTLGRRVL